MLIGFDEETEFGDDVEAMYGAVDRLRREFQEIELWNDEARTKVNQMRKTQNEIVTVVQDTCDALSRHVQEFAELMDRVGCIIDPLNWSEDVITEEQAKVVGEIGIEFWDAQGQAHYIVRDLQDLARAVGQCYDPNAPL